MKLWATERKLVTAVTLVYNQLPFARRAVESLVQFNGLAPEDFEYVLWDQGAPYPGVDEWLHGLEGPTVLGGGFNIGVGASLNNVISNTDSEFLFKLDDDCEILPWTLPLLVLAYSIAQSTGFLIGVLSADVIGVGKAQGPSHDVELAPGLTLQCHGCVGGGAVLISRKVLDEVGPFRADRLYGVEDGDFADRCQKKGYQNAYLKGAYHISYCRGDEADPLIDNWKTAYYHHSTDLPFDEWSKR